ncbi:MAG: protein translocase subunit SecF [Ardenticatenales bacterium]|nr:protein translocase subunit SecF [Ardenticatenales bacterium]
MFNIIKNRYFFYALSLLLIIPGLISLVMWGLNLSIDFTGGSLLDLRFESPTTPLTTEDIRADLTALGYTNPIVQLSDDDTALIRVPEINNDAKNAITSRLSERYGTEAIEQRFEAVGPAVGGQVTQGAIFAVIAATLGILGYLAFAFRDVEHPLRYGVVTILAMLHDVLVVLGLASLAGHFLGWEVDALFLTALLTVIGFSVHDSIVVFDRVRENLVTHRGESFDSIVNHSVIQTLDRSINTQLTALFTLFAVYLFGGGPIQQFVLWLIIGVISGTYSSIFNAAPLLVSWENGELGRLFGRGPRDPRQAPA